ncbi:MAG: glycoside hydrolase family 88 protein, partial [Treponema sp.]|nr:glycoside hydrolase family 88 protein [Treponema sp.]
WFQVVDKPAHPRNWHDTSGSAMFLYSIKKAGLLGIADRTQCDRIAEKAFEGLKTKCIADPEGNINIYDACDGLCVQINYDTYVDFIKNVNCKEAVAAFFWACVIMEFGI